MSSRLRQTSTDFIQKSARIFAVSPYPKSQTTPPYEMGYFRQGWVKDGILSSRWVEFLSNFIKTSATRRPVASSDMAHSRRGWVKDRILSSRWVEFLSNFIRISARRPVVYFFPVSFMKSEERLSRFIELLRSQSVLTTF